MIIAAVSIDPRPAFPHNIGFRIVGNGHIMKPFQDFDVFLMVIGFVGSNCIHAETVSTMIDPELCHFFDLCSNGLVLQIQIRHTGPETSLIVPAAPGKLFISGLRLFGKAIIVHIGANGRIRFFVLSEPFDISGSLLKPGMFRRGMIDHRIQDQVDSSPVTFFHQQIKILHGTVLGIDGHVIRNIIFMIRRGRTDGHQPDLIKSKIRIRGRVSVIDHIQFTDKALQVTDPVPIAVTIGIYKHFITGTVFIIRHIYSKCPVQRLHLIRGRISGINYF